MKNLNTNSQDYCTATAPLALVGTSSASQFKMTDYTCTYKLKSYKKLLFVLLLPFLSSNVLAMERENNIEDGTYRIRCKKGQQSLELNPEGTAVRLAKEETNEQYQKWSIKNVGNNFYSISCFTKYEDKKYLEAFPIINAVKPEFEDEGEDDQEWQITKIEPAVYQIH